MAHILVVEDNPANSELLCDWLDIEGYRFTAVTNLEQSYAAFAGDPPHLVLLDVQLGAEDGLELAAWVKDHPRFRRIPVIAVTAHAMVTDQERVIHAGCVACIPKPIDFNALRAKMEAYLPEM